MVRPRPRRDRDPTAGYTLVALMVATTVLGILLATALPVWSHVMQREREAELVFRGLQYAEAIRVFQRRFGRYPNRLEELIEVRPRSIRQLWKDPVTGGSWGLVHASAGQNPAAPPQGGQPGAVPNPNQVGMAPEGMGGGVVVEPEGEPGRTETGFGSSTPTQTVGPIIGVYSRSTKESVRTFMGQQNYNRWRFLVQNVPLPSPGPGGTFPRFSSATFGRPFAGGAQPQMGVPPGGLQDGSAPGGRPRPQGRPGGRP